MSLQAKRNSEDKVFNEKLKSAVITGQTKVVQRLLKGGVDINASFRHGYSLLHEAVIGGHVDIIKLLIDAKADINAYSQDRRSALHMACRTGHTDIVDLLLKSGANQNSQTSDGRAALHIAMWRSHEGIAMKLLRNGANPSIRDSDGWTGLHWACKTSSHLCANYIIDHCPRLINTVDSFGRTSLYVALENVNHVILPTLLIHGADPNLHPRMSGCSSMVIALKKNEGNEPAAINWLLKAGYSISSDSALLTASLPPDVTENISRFLLEPSCKVSRLSDLCRFSIRRQLSKCLVNSSTKFLDNIEQLPLPQSLKEYVALSDRLPVSLINSHHHHQLKKRRTDLLL